MEINRPWSIHGLFIYEEKNNSLTGRGPSIHGPYGKRSLLSSCSRCSGCSAFYPWNLWGKLAIYSFRHFGNKSITEEKGIETDSVCLKEAVSEEFTTSVIKHVLNGVSPTHPGITNLPKTITPENILFQPEWHGIEAIENGIQLKRA